MTDHHLCNIEKPLCLFPRELRRPKFKNADDLVIQLNSSNSHIQIGASQWMFSVFEAYCPNSFHCIKYHCYILSHVIKTLEIFEFNYKSV